MTWQYAGTLAASLDKAWEAYDLAVDATHHGQPVETQGQHYLVSHGYLVPFFRPSQSGFERQHIRERLNMELCDRVFRISDARDVARDAHEADEAIAALMKRYDALPEEQRRGIGRVLFGRIVSRIRTLSQEYLATHHDHTNAQVSQDEIHLLKQIHDLYEYVMVEHPEIFQCVRLFDLSEDCDGIIEEVFSEIGKTQQIPIEAIYANRVRKIGAAMRDMQATCDTLLSVVLSLPNLFTHGEAEAFGAYAVASMQLVGIPSSDHLNYDEAASRYVDRHDAARQMISDLDNSAHKEADIHRLAEWLHQGVALIHSMQNLRDGRPQSLLRYRQSAGQWLGHHANHKASA